MSDRHRARPVLYALDVAAWIAVGAVYVAIGRSPSRPLFAALLALGVWFVGQGLGWVVVGVRGLYAFPILLPAAVALVLAAVLGLRGRLPARLMNETPTTALAAGCAIEPVTYMVGVGFAFALAGQPIGIVFAALVTLAVALFIRLMRRSDVAG